MSANTKNLKTDYRRFRLAVPESDIDVINWLDSQANVSFSVRTLIKQFVEEHGYMDATCLSDEEMPVRARRGRPPNKGSLYQPQPGKLPEETSNRGSSRGRRPLESHRDDNSEKSDGTLSNAVLSQQTLSNELNNNPKINNAPNQDAGFVDDIESLLNL